jgi:hypothetical protein
MNFRWLFPKLPKCDAAEKLLEQNADLSRQLSEKLDDLVEEATTMFDRRRLPDVTRDDHERRAPHRRAMSG